MKITCLKSKIHVLALFLVLAFEAANCEQSIGCQGCIAISTILEHELYHPEQPEDPAGPGRRMRFKLTEGEVIAALDGVCSKYSHGREDAVEACKTFLAPIKPALENFILQKGVDHQLRKHLCIDLANKCSMHTLFDSGEL